MAERWSAGRLVARRVRVAPAASILVGVITLLAVTAAAVAPRLIERQATAELTSQLEVIGPLGRSLQGAGDFPQYWSPDPPPDLTQLYSGIQGNFEWTRGNLPKPLSGLVGAPGWIVQTTTIQGVPQQGTRPFVGLQLTADPKYLARVRIVEGAAPSTWSANEGIRSADETRTIPVDVAVSTVAAAQLHLSVGDLVGTDVLGGVPQRLYRISGLFAPKDPSNDYWKQNGSLVPVTTALARYGVAYPSVAAFVAPLSVGHLANTFGAARLSVWYPLSATGADGADAALLARQLAQAQTTGAAVEHSTSPLPLATRSQQAVETAEQRSGLLAGLLALLAAAPLGLLIAVLALGVQVVARARRTELILANARGGSAWQLRGELAFEGAILSIPTAVVVTALATLLIPVRIEPSGFVWPALVAVLPPILFAALAETRERPGPLATILGQLRGIAEIAVVVLAVLSVFLLSRRGLAQATEQVGVDPLLSVAPLLLAVSVGIIVLRGYPLPMRLARRLAVRGRSLPAFIGAIRAARAPTVGLAGVLALVVGISVALFSTVLLTTFESSVTRAAQESVGADARVDGFVLTPQQVSAVRAVDGARNVAAIDYLSSLTATDSPYGSVSVLLAQTGQLSTMRPLPAGLTHLVGGRVPVVVSSDVLKAMGSQRTATVQGVKVRVVGSLPAASGLGVDEGWMMVDETFTPKFTGAFLPATLLIKADPDKLDHMLAPLQKAVGISPTADRFTATISVTTVPQAIADRESEPVIAGVRIGLVSGAILATLLCVLALILATAATAAARGRTAGILRTLGMPRRRLGILIAWELIPVAAVALAAGAVLGCLLPFVVTAAVDLRPFTGGLQRPVPVLDPGLLGLVLGSFCLVVLISGAIAVAVGDRVNPSSTLKMGA
jgi:putative ABC transport system permease protein